MSPPTKVPSKPTKAASGADTQRANPTAGTLQTIHGYPDRLKIFRIPASSYWWVRATFGERRIKRSTKETDKAKAIRFAKQFYEELLRNDLAVPLKTSKSFARAALSLQEEHRQKAATGERNKRFEADLRKQLKRRILPFFKQYALRDITYDVLSKFVSSMEKKMPSRSKLLGLALLAFLLESCGGGGAGSSTSAAPTAPAPTATISASTQNVSQGDSVTLTWSSTNATSCTASGGWTGQVATSGSQSVSVSAAGSVVFSLSCANGSGSATAQATVNSAAKPAPTVNVSASSQIVIAGATTTLTWSSTNATSCAASGAWNGALSATGSKAVTVSDFGISKYTLSCTGVGGTTTTDVSVTGVKDPLRVISGVAFDAGDAGLDPRWVISDFNKDGIKDIALRYDPESAFSTTTTGTSPLRFFVGKQEGGFIQSPGILPDTYSPTLVNRIIVDDFNGDGSPDIAVAAAGQDPYENSMNAASGHGGAYTQILTYSPAGYRQWPPNASSQMTFGHHISSGDIDGDSLPDALVTSMMYVDALFVMGDRNSNYKTDLTRFAKNTFAPNVVERFSDGTTKKYEAMRFTSSAMLDANGDGKIDIALMAAGGAKTSVIMLNDGSGHFSKDKMIELPAGPFGAGYYFYDSPNSTKAYEVGTIHLDTLAVDINGDGKKDLISIVTSTNSSPSEYIYYRDAAVQVLINSGNGFTDESKQRISFTHNPGKNFTHYDTLEYSDINNDGFPDILLHRAQINFSDSASATRILINDGKGRFTERPYPSSLPKGIVTVIGPGHYAVLFLEKNSSTGKYTQRVDDVYYDWGSGLSLFP